MTDHNGLNDRLSALEDEFGVETETVTIVRKVVDSDGEFTGEEKTLEIQLPRSR